MENERNRRYTRKQGLADLIEVVDGSLEDLPFEDDEFDVVWSHDAMLLSGDRVRVLKEVARVLRPRGEFVFADPMASDGCDSVALRLILDRLRLESMGSPSFYRRELSKLGLCRIEFDDHTEQLADRCGRVMEETGRCREEIGSRVSESYLTHMEIGLTHWVEGGKAGNLAWGVFHARA
ncbi:class I SAM-dependent methyltransferase [Saccharomonospora xinjiangensis]|uniref:class I SAM-dependent methyltransferase n=1 Tax=Saccharomonospora xinjiangensis TaxID=75294 RepID=UPI00030B6732